MSKYELDDHDVQVILTDLRGHSSAMASEIAGRIEAQIPLPVPTKLSAVVRTTMDVRGPRTFVRTCTDGHSANPWQQINAPEEPALPTDQIGRIVEVLSEGVDL